MSVENDSNDDVTVKRTTYRSNYVTNEVNNAVSCTIYDQDLQLCVSLNRFRMYDGKNDLHRNQKAIQCLNNNNNSSNAFAKEVLAWHFFEFHIVRNAERRQMAYNGMPWNEMRLHHIPSREIQKQFAKKLSKKIVVNDDYSKIIEIYYLHCFGDLARSWFTIVPMILDKVTSSSSSSSLVL